MIVLNGIAIGIQVDIKYVSLIKMKNSFAFRVEQKKWNEISAANSK